MNPRNIVIVTSITAFAFGFTSCKKENSSAKNEIETTVELSTDQAISDNLVEDANDVFMEAATDKGLTGETPATPFESMGILGCASVTVTPLLGFPNNRN